MNIMTTTAIFTQTASGRIWFLFLSINQGRDRLSKFQQLPCTFRAPVHRFS